MSIYTFRLAVTEGEQNADVSLIEGSVVWYRYPLLLTLWQCWHYWHYDTVPLLTLLTLWHYWHWLCWHYWHYWHYDTIPLLTLLTLWQYWHWLCWHYWHYWHYWQLTLFDTTDTMTLTAVNSGNGHIYLVKYLRWDRILYSVSVYDSRLSPASTKWLMSHHYTSSWHLSE